MNELTSDIHESIEHFVMEINAIYLYSLSCRRTGLWSFQNKVIADI
jgi:hypothetical protein